MRVIYGKTQIASNHGNNVKSEDLNRGGLNNSTNSITSFTYY